MVVIGCGQVMVVTSDDLSPVISDMVLADSSRMRLSILLVRQMLVSEGFRFAMTDRTRLREGYLPTQVISSTASRTYVSYVNSSWCRSEHRRARYCWRRSAQSCGQIMRNLSGLRCNRAASWTSDAGASSNAFLSSSSV